MSRPVDERLRLLAAEVQDLPVRPAAVVRARGRRRGRRQMAAALMSAAVVATAGGVTVTRLFDRPHQDAPAVASLAARCVLTLPRDPSEVRVRVLDGGAPAGSGAATAAEFRKRGFTVLPGADGGTAGASALDYGPAAIGAAALLRAELVGGADMHFDPGRSGDLVDLTVGTDFVRLATPTEINQALVAAGQPSAPPGC